MTDPIMNKMWIVRFDLPLVSLDNPRHRLREWISIVARDEEEFFGKLITTKEVAMQHRGESPVSDAFLWTWKERKYDNFETYYKEYCDRLANGQLDMITELIAHVKRPQGYIRWILNSDIPRL